MDSRVIGGFVISGMAVLCATFLYAQGETAGATNIADLAKFMGGVAIGLASSWKAGKR